MGNGAPRSFYVQRWMTTATYVLGALQLGFAGILLALGSTLDVGVAIPIVFAIGGLLTAYQAYWTAKTPIATLAEDGVEFRPAMLAREVRIRFADVRAFARIPPGWLVFLAADGSETRIPLTALSEEDAERLVKAVSEQLTEVSYVET